MTDELTRLKKLLTAARGIRASSTVFYQNNILIHKLAFDQFLKVLNEIEDSSETLWD